MEKLPPQKINQMKQQRTMTLTHDEKDTLRACIEFVILEARIDRAETQHLLRLLQKIRELDTDAKEETQGPYAVRHHRVHAAWAVYGPFDLAVATYFYGEHYPYTKETAKAAAEAERARLNKEWLTAQKAEYRKEQK